MNPCSTNLPRETNERATVDSNIVLIGMPGAGKSTVGVILAKLTGRDFVDTDVLIQLEEGRKLQDIVDADGYQVLREIEERVLLGLTCRHHVVATGGSAAYSEPAMRHLGQSGRVVFLDVDRLTLESRVKDFGSRGLARRADQTFEHIFNERYPLYQRHANIQVSCSGLTPEEVCAAIMGTEDAGDA